MKKLTNEQKIEIAGVIIVKSIFMESLEKILRDCRITKEQARECLLHYINQERSSKSEKIN
jgi:hypothetical protein